jgi:hypothetical protein
MLQILKNGINTLQTKITNKEDIADSYFKNILTQLESCYQLIMVNIIEVPVDNLEIQNLKVLINVIPSFPTGFFIDWLTVKLNSAKVTSVLNPLPSTLTSANWTSIFNVVNCIPSGFFTDWNKMFFITKSETKELEIILEDIVIE